MLGVGFAGLVYSHVLTTVLGVVVCGAICLIHWKSWITDSKKLKKLLGTILGVLVVTAAYWAPMMEQWLVQQYRAVNPWTWVDENVIRVYDLFTAYGGVGFVLTALTIIIGFWLKESGENRKGIIEFFLIGLTLLLLPTVSKFWQITREAFKFLQFPGRLMMPATVVLILTVSLVLTRLRLQERTNKAVILLLFLVSIYVCTGYIDSKVENREDLAYRTLHEEIAGIGSGEEWLPIQTYREHLQNPEIAYDENGNAIQGVKEEGYYTFETDGKSAYYDIPFVWYKGFKALDEKGNEWAIVQKEENGLVRVLVNQQENRGKIIVWYDGTLLQSIAYVITSVGMIVIMGFFLYTHTSIRGNLRMCSLQRRSEADAVPAPDAATEKPDALL